MALISSGGLITSQIKLPIALTSKFKMIWKPSLFFHKGKMTAEIMMKEWVSLKNVFY